jgi:predicted Zn-dependent peptidase
LAADSPVKQAPSRITLDNGLRVVALEQPNLHRALVALYVRVGSRFETEKTNGLSHFLEHMLYRGTPRLKTAHDVNLAFESLGGYLYAATQVDYAVFSVAVPVESLDAACDLFADVLTEPTFADIDLEKGIVCEEILEDLDDDGRQIDADNLSRELIYPNHPLGFTITGTEKTVKSFDVPMLHALHEQHFVSDGSILVFAGNVAEKHAFSLAEKCFAKFPNRDCSFSKILRAKPNYVFRFARSRKAHRKNRRWTCSCVSSTTACRRASIIASAMRAASVTT